MENNEKNIDDLFREELGGYTETPPPAVWDALERKLAKVPRGPRTPGRKIWYFGALCLLLLLSIPALKQIAGITGSGNKTVAANENTNTNATTSAHSSNTSNNTTQKETAVADNNQATTGENNRPINGKFTSNTASETSTGDKQANGTNEPNATGTPGQPKIQAADNSEQHKPGKTLQNKSVASVKAKKQARNRSRRTKNTNVNDRTVAEKGTWQSQRNVYNSSGSTSKPSTAEETDDNATAATKATTPEKEVKPAEAKTTDAVTNKKPLTKTEPAKKPKPKFSAIEVGIKVGYESGFDNDASKKAVVSPYIQFNISPRFSIMTQPSVKLASLDSRRIGNAKSYYKENNDSTASQIGNSVGVQNPSDGTVFFYITHFAYSQSHDSIIKSNSIGGYYTELELPLLLKYRISNNLSVYGGVNVIYGKSIGIGENTSTVKQLKVNVADTFVSQNSNPAPPPTNSVITYKGTDISNYTGPQYTTTTTGQWRAGYMIGFSYEFSKRWLFDGLLQQANVKSNVQAGYNVNNALSLPYFRFTLGYKLIK